MSYGTILSRLLGIGVALALASAAPCLGQTQARASGPEFRIGNNVFVVPDKNARSITGWLIVLAGCADEADGKCVGIAHYLEHLLFINRDSDNRSKVAMFADGSGNGWTTHRTTAYFQRFPARPATNAENLEKLMSHFAGLLSDVRVEGAQADRERNVVLQEYQQNTGRNPFARFAVGLNLAMMPDEPLGQRVIGSPETISAFTTDAARAFHARWYARTNAAIVLHGPIGREDVAALVARHIAPLPAKPVPPNAWKTKRAYEPGQQLIRATEKDARQIGVYFDKLVTFEETAVARGINDAANGVLGSFLSSRLAESPVENMMERDGLVSEARLGVARVRDGTMRISFSGVPAAGVAPEKVLDAARVYIANLARTGLTQETVDRLKQRITNERALLAEQPGLYAQALMNWLSSHGTYERWNTRQARHAAITAADVNRLLALVAGPGREVAGVMLPGAPSAAGVASTRDAMPLPVPSTVETPPQQAHQPASQP